MSGSRVPLRGSGMTEETAIIGNGPGRAPDAPHSITAAFMITTMVARAGPSMQRTLCGLSQR